MFLSDDLGFIFLHVPKTGGMSMRLALRAVSKDCKIDFPRLHLTSEELRGVVGPVRWSNYYKFAFIRNPWEWNISLWRFLIENPKWLLLDKEWKALSRAEFKERREYFLNEDILQWLKHFKWEHYSPCEGYSIQECTQLDWLTDISVDIYKYEDLDISLIEISKRIGREIILPHINKTEKKPYYEYYTPESAALVQKRNAQLIDRYNYSF